MAGICVTSLSFTVPFFFVSDTFTRKSWGLQLLLYKCEYKAMKKYESNSKKPGITQKHAALPLSSGGSLMVTVDRFFKYASIWPCSALCLAKARSSYSRAVQVLWHTRDCWCQWSRSGRHGFIACSPAMKRGSFHSASAVNWAHSDCVNPGHVAVSLQSRTRFYLLKWWLLSWEVVLSAAVAANFVGGEKCWFIVLFSPNISKNMVGCENTFEDTAGSRWNRTILKFSISSNWSFTLLIFYTMLLHLIFI